MIFGNKILIELRTCKNLLRTCKNLVARSAAVLARF
jgi:hypothetical protein